MCSVDITIVESIANNMNPRPDVVSLNPQNIWEVLDELPIVGEAAGKLEKAKVERAAL